jgi:3-keto-disaccharide hydrolase
MSTRHLSLLISFVVGFHCLPAAAENREYLNGIEWPEPAVVTPGTDGSPPSDAIVLFDGSNLSAWEGAEHWKIEDGDMVVGKGDIKTKQSFDNFQLHIEWSTPVPAKGSDQDRGNSGVFLQDHYELQVLDSYGNKTYFDGQAGAIYKQTPPMVNAMRPPGEWNVYDILWTAPRFNEDGSLASPAYITALQNGVAILNHFRVLGENDWHAPPTYRAHGKEPIRLQDHGHPVRFRNIWVRDLVPIEGRQVKEPYYHDHDTDRKWLVREGEHAPAE